MNRRRVRPGVRPVRRRLIAALGLATLPVIVAAACEGGDALRDPAATAVAGAAPDSFTVVMETSKGVVEIEFVREWSPLGVDRVHDLVERGFFDGARFFRVNPRVVQFGFSGRPELDSLWRTRPIEDEPVRASNLRGAVSFAKAGPNTRDFQLFINRIDNPDYDTCCAGGFAPIGRVVRGMEAIDLLYAGYGEPGPGVQDRIMAEGNDYLRAEFALLDSIAQARIR
ncbi:MAG: peptidylprolyl isomerase [Gemmatimonadetes bacterium]|nr:peptidylprolyl isomerase [Gemmatimonadota bacterium]